VHQLVVKRFQNILSSLPEPLLVLQCAGEFVE